MTRVWLHAGTRCVIAAPVVVADDAACELLGAMHEGLAAGEPPAEALAQAAAAHRDRRAVPGARRRILKIACIRAPRRVLLLFGDDSQQPVSGDSSGIGGGRHGACSGHAAS